MTTNFPGGLDNFVNPAGTSLLTNPDHAGQHTDLNDAVEALEAKVGVNGSLVTSSIDYKLANDVVLKSVVDAKGDLIAGTAADAVARLGVGANDTVLMARSGETTGLAWGAPRLAGGAARPLLTGGAYLSGSGLVLNALSGNYASSPDSAALSITGDIDIKVKVAMTDWTPAAQQTIIGKYQTNTTRSYVLSAETNGRISLYWSTNGTTTDRSATSTVATGVSDGATKWVRATLDVDNGSSQHSVKFYTSDDGTTWTQLGTTVTNANTTSIFDSTSQLEIGSLVAGTGNLLAGTVYRTIIQSAYDTANNTDNLVYDANFETATADALAFTESSTNAATVTINTTRYTFGIPTAHFGTSGSTTTTAANRTYFNPFQVTSPITVDMVINECTTVPSSTSTFKAAIYAADNNFQAVGAPVVDFGSITISTTAAAIYTKQITPVTLQPGIYLLAFNDSVAYAHRTIRAGLSFMISTSTVRVLTNMFLAETNSLFPSTAPVWNNRVDSTVNEYMCFLRWRAA